MIESFICGNISSIEGISVFHKKEDLIIFNQQKRHKTVQVVYNDMAGARVKYQSIFKRVQGLLRSGAITEENKPVWYSVYEAFPPMEEYDIEKKCPSNPAGLKKIIYPEDILKANFYEYYSNPEVVDFENDLETLATKFAKEYLARTKSANENERTLFPDLLKVFAHDHNLEMKREDVEALEAKKFKLNLKIKEGYKVKKEFVPSEEDIVGTYADLETDLA